MNIYTYLKHDTEKFLNSCVSNYFLFPTTTQDNTEPMKSIE